MCSCCIMLTYFEDGLVGCVAFVLVGVTPPGHHVPCSGLALPPAPLHVGSHLRQAAPRAVWLSSATAWD